jgi:hypothetical protein
VTVDRLTQIRSKVATIQVRLDDIEAPWNLGAQFILYSLATTALSLLDEEIAAVTS